MVFDFQGTGILQHFEPFAPFNCTTFQCFQLATGLHNSFSLCLKNLYCRKWDGQKPKWPSAGACRKACLWLIYPLFVVAICFINRWISAWEILYLISLTKQLQQGNIRSAICSKNPTRSIRPADVGRNGVVAVSQVEQLPVFFVNRLAGWIAGVCSARLHSNSQVHQSRASPSQYGRWFWFDQKSNGAWTRIGSLCFLFSFVGVSNTRGFCIMNYQHLEGHYVAMFFLKSAESWSNWNVALSCHVLPCQFFL